MATALTATTLGAAVGKDDNTIAVAAITNIHADYVLFVDGEAMLVVAEPITGTLVVKVKRGYGNTFATAHASGAVLWTNPSAAYYESDPRGAGSTTTVQYLPHVSLQTGSAYTIVNGQWVRFIDRGFPVALPGGSRTLYTVDATTAVALVGGTHTINTGATTAFTLAAPDGNTPEGTIINFVCLDAYTHTLTQAGSIGFLSTGTSSDVASFTAVAGAGFSVQNIGGAWKAIAITQVANTSTVTFG